ncbi:transglycosylase SLT domain-containing protein [Saccharibacter sp. 17.LH.SD]|uniref:lytic transglycosylase domain-containing protein n=1 Tax=Saccharibacter sp. 17.LH.SD TaxID=2689393 RepID=UPI001371F0E3|nr:lytic transglycosylase domain-containing protein [Saccharibacter sp. 17.LH.SD]MXV44259.1 transglycosylase SLT domain-containing protein [Saccharibacter sp. 17.LH.SD]
MLGSFLRINLSAALYPSFFGFLLFSTPLGLAATPDDNPSPVAERLTEWKALTAPNALSFPAQRYADFLKQSPSWPLQHRIEWRYQNALAQETNSDTLRALCPKYPLTQLSALLTCTSTTSISRKKIRHFWVENLTTPGDEALFLQNFQSSLTKDDQWNRYILLEQQRNKSAALRQIHRLTPDEQSRAQIRWDYYFNAPDADTPDAQQVSLQDPTILLYRLKWLREHNSLDEAYQLWQQHGLAAEQTANSPRPQLWTTERLSLARLLLRQPNNTQTAQRIIVLTSGRTLPESSPLRQDEQILNGYVWLTYLGNANKAEESFAPLTHNLSLSPHAASFYWSARCAEAEHNVSQATNLYQKASQYPTTFYGQLALAHLTHTSLLSQSQRPTNFLIALQHRLNALPSLPPGTPIFRQDLVEAAQILQSQGDDKDATLFLSFLQAHTGNIAAQQSVANLATRLNLPKAAVMAARTLAKHGLVLYPEGYPVPVQIQDSALPSLPSGLLQALIRQESSTDRYAISPRHAIGMAQLLYPTAKITAQRHGLSARSLTPQALTDPNINIHIGSFYLQDLLSRFNQVIPYALAGYNAGPAKAQRWRNNFSEFLPASPITMSDDDQILHWIILIPYHETRHYIEQIETDMSLYASMAAKQ